MDRYLIYNFSGEIDDLSHLFPNERLAQAAAVIKAEGADVEIWDRGNIRTLSELAPAAWKRGVAAWAGKPIFRKLAQNAPITRRDKMLYGLPLKWATGSMSRDLDANYAAFMRQEADHIAKGGFKALFLNLWQGGFDESMAMAKRVKELCDLPIYAIGQRVDWFQEHVLRLFPQIDGIILGLGYDAIRRLVRGEAFPKLNDVVWRDAHGGIRCAERCVANVDDLPPPVYDPEVYHDVEHMIPLVHISLSNQACPNRCAFCPRPMNYGRVVRRKPVEHAVDEVAALREQGMRYFRIADSTPPPKQLTHFARGIVDRGLHEKGIHLTAFARVDQNREEDFGLLRKARFESLFFGLESLDDKGLERIRKGITWPEIKATLHAAHDAGFFVVGSMIFPLPHDTEETRETNFNRLREIAPFLDSVLIQPAGVYPYSDWGQQPEEFGIHVPPGYVEELMNYPVKFIIPMRFWPPFPFSYPLMGKPAEEVTFDDIREAFEGFSNRVWQELKISNVQDYTLLVAQMIKEDAYAFTDRVKEILVTRNYGAIHDVVARSRAHLAE